ncbi:MAG: putative ABC transporter permease [Bacillota bacterium]
MVKRFLIYGLVGWSMEIIWTGLHSLVTGDLKLQGYTNLWMFFIYGAAIFLEPLHDVIREWRWLFRGTIWVVIIWGIEYTSGLVLVNLLDVYPWFYSGPFAVDNLVRLDYAPAWFAAGLIFERIHKTLDVYDVA